MTMTPNKNKLAIQLGELLEKLQGKALTIQEWLSHNVERGFDRHCTIQNVMHMTVEKSMWHMSGGHYYLYGTNEQQFAFLTGQLNDIQILDDEIILTELFETKTVRKIVLKLNEKV